ncbi:MAG: hypothetical protein R6U96_05025 [Promethearchaeia archaeon]
MSEETEMSEETREVEASPKDDVEQVTLRNLSKAIFFYPLFFTSLVLGLIQMFVGEPIPILANFWISIFFLNLFVIAFDFNSTKFFVLILGIIVIALLVIFLVFPNIDLPEIDIEFTIVMSAEFYLVMTILLGIILGLIILSSRFDYWTIERNEIYHKTGLLGDAKRYPMENFRFEKEIPDVFELLSLKAGSITLKPDRQTSIRLRTVVNVNEKEEQLDYLLSRKHVQVD